VPDRIDPAPHRIVLVHGFTQTGTTWAEVAARLGGLGAEVRCPDQPGHGGAGDVRTDLTGAAARLAALADGTPATWVGYSMGGRILVSLALDHPEVVDRLVLVSTTAGLEAEEERAARRAADEQLADELEAMGVAAFLERWLAQPLFARLPPEAAGREARLVNTAEGLASSLRLAGTGTMAPRWHELHRIDVPVLVVAGAEDAKFVALAERLHAAIGANATLAVLPGAGHAVPFEQPDAFSELLVSWLSAVSR